VKLLECNGNGHDAALALRTRLNLIITAGMSSRFIAIQRIIDGLEIAYHRLELFRQSNDLRNELYNQVIFASRLLEIVPMNGVHRASFILRIMFEVTQLGWDTPLNSMYWALRPIFDHYSSLIDFIDTLSLHHSWTLTHTYTSMVIAIQLNKVVDII
jgi:hypothetical protein